MVSEKQVWTEIDLSAYRHNIRELKRFLASGTRFMAVVKADAYGHGAMELTRAALVAGTDWLGVARLEEGLELRRAGLEAPILIFGFTSPADVRALAENRLAQTVFSHSMAEALAHAARNRGLEVRTHIKVDTGMGRLGVLATEAPVERRLHEVQSIATGSQRLTIASYRG